MSRDDPAVRAPTETSPLLSEVLTHVPVTTSAGGPLPEPRNFDTAATDSDDSSDLLDDDEDLDKPRIPGARIELVLPALCVGIFLAAMDNTIVVTSFGRIGSDLNALNKTSWIATAYLLTTTSFQPLYGKLSDIFGRKKVLIFAYAVFGLGCLGCGLARTFNEIVAARAFSGIGGGGMTTVVSILVSDLVPLRSRGTWQGVLNIIFATGMAVGGPLGGLFCDTIGWRWAFIFQFPMTLIAITLVSIFFNVPDPSNLPASPSSSTSSTISSSQESFKSRLKRIDVLGATTLIIAVLSLLIGLDRLGNLSPSDPYALASLSLSLLFFALFILTEKRLAAEPFAPAHIVTEPTILACTLTNFLTFGAYMALMFYLPLYMQVVSSLTPGQAGLRLLPAIFGGVAGSLGGGLVMQKTGRYWWLTVGMYGVMLIGNLTVLASTGLFLHSGLLNEVGIFLSGLGNGVGVTTTLIALIAAAGTEDQAIATAVSYLFRALGTVVGLAGSSMLVQEKLRRELVKRLGDGEEAVELARKIRESIDFVKTLEGAKRVAAVESYEAAVRSAFVVSCVMGVVGVGVSTWVKERRLSR